MLSVDRLLKLYIYIYIYIYRMYISDGQVANSSEDFSALFANALHEMHFSIPGS